MPDDLRGPAPPPSVREILVDLAFSHRRPEVILADAIAAVFSLGERMPRARVQALLETALDSVSTSGPSPVWINAAEDAAMWAAMAPPHELRAYVLAGGRELRGRVLPPDLAKRLMVDLWGQLSDEDRRRFLQRADPDGKFRRA